jgi:hypothetical protein
MTVARTIMTHFTQNLRPTFVTHGNILSEKLDNFFDFYQFKYIFCAEAQKMSYRFFLSLEKAIRKILHITPIFEINLKVCTPGEISQKFSGSFLATPAFMKEFMELCNKHFSWRDYNTEE